MADRSVGSRDPKSLACLCRDQLSRSAGTIVDQKLLLKHFNADPGSAFIEVIRSAKEPVDSKRIREVLKAAGARPADLDSKWETMRTFIKEHPNIRKPKTTQYEW